MTAKEYLDKATIETLALRRLIWLTKYNFPNGEYVYEKEVFSSCAPLRVVYHSWETEFMPNTHENREELERFNAEIRPAPESDEHIFGRWDVGADAEFLKNGEWRVHSDFNDRWKNALEKAVIWARRKGEQSE